MQERSARLNTNADLRNTRTIVLDKGDPEEKREEIRQYFHQTCAIEEALFETLKYCETFYRRADALRHPLIFYFGHTAVFYVNKLIIAKLTEKRVNARFESMFAIGVDEMSWDDIDMSHYDWPEVEEVQAYRNTVRELVDERIRTMPLSMPIDWENPFWVIMMGIEHARIHLETSSVLIRQLPVGSASSASPMGDLPHLPRGSRERAHRGRDRKVLLGKKKDHPLYGWDNEFGEHQVEIDAYRASRYLVTNREFYEFVEDKGYSDRRDLRAGDRRLSLGYAAEGLSGRRPSGTRCFTRPFDLPRQAVLAHSAGRVCPRLPLSLRFLRDPIVLLVHAQSPVDRSSDRGDPACPAGAGR